MKSWGVAILPKSAITAFLSFQLDILNIKTPNLHKKWGLNIQRMLTSQRLSVGLNVSEYFFPIKPESPMSNKFVINDCLRGRNFNDL